MIHGVTFGAEIGVIVVGALVWDQIARARLSEALRQEARVRYCERHSELITLVEQGLATAIVLDRRDRDGGSTLPSIRRIRDEFPSIPVVLYCALSPEASREVLEFARAGVDQLVFQDVDDLRTPLRGAVQAAQDIVSAKSLLGDLEPHLSPNVIPFVRYCLEHARRDLTVEEVAGALGVHRKTLVDRLSASSLPSPSSIISWSRLLVAARILEDPGRTVEQAALMLDFPSGSSLRNMMKRYTGLRSGEVRENGGVRCVLHAFKRALAATAAGQRRE
jgi:AraC-like DNA-binding protein